MLAAGIRHPGMPCPLALSSRARAAAQNVGYSTNADVRRRRESLEGADRAYFQAYLDRALVCPVRYESRPSSWRCRLCGALDRYERLVPAWVALRSEGDPDDEREAYTEIIDDTATICCLACEQHDNFDELPRSPAALPDWSIDLLDGTERATLGQHGSIGRYVYERR